nr:hypothetical protein CFP56_49951 [Quercus suber]
MSEAPMLLYAVDSSEVVNGSNSDSAKKRRQDVMKIIEEQVAVLGIVHSEILQVLLELKENCDTSFEYRVAITDYVMNCAQASKLEQQLMEGTGCHPLDEAEKN